MGSVNKVILVGNLGADPELKYTASTNMPVCNLSVATNERTKEGEKVEWHRVTAWKETAENCAKYLAKGRSVYVEGRLSTRKWKDKDGVDRYSTEIMAERVVFLGGGEEKPANGKAKHREQKADPHAGDELPDF